MATPANITTLNQFAKGLFANSSNRQADFLAPPVVTGAAQFFVNDYAQRSSFQVPNSKRPIGGDSTAVVSDGERVQITLKPHALHDLIDDHEIDLAGNQGGAALLREGRTRNLVNQGANSRLSETLSVVRAAVSADNVTWNSSADPVDKIDEMIQAIADEIGVLPNRIQFSLNAWRIFRNNDKVIARHPGAAKVAVQANDVGGMFLNPNMQVDVSTAVFDAPLKATKAKANALASEVLIFYSAENADMFDSSFAKTFRVRSNPFGGIRVERKDFGEKLITEWTEDVYINNAAAGKRLNVSQS